MGSDAVPRQFMSELLGVENPQFWCQKCEYEGEGENEGE